MTITKLPVTYEHLVRTFESLDQVKVFMDSIDLAIGCSMIVYHQPDGAYSFTACRVHGPVPESNSKAGGAPF